MNYILAIDQGTTGSTACLIHADTFEFVGKCNKEYPQIYPTPGWVEHNLNDIWETIGFTVQKVLKDFNVSGAQIKCIGLTNQRETTCAFSKDGTPLHNAIVWQDRRTAQLCEELRKNNLAEKVKEKTGLTIDPYFSSTKMHWLLNNADSVKKAAKEENLRFGTIDTFLLYKLSGNSAYKTDASNASRTMLMNLKTLKWDQELLDLFGVKSQMLPEITDSFGIFGHTKGLNFLPDGIPVSGILGDQQSALFGQSGFNQGDFKCTYGTGAFLLFNTGSNLLYSKNGLLTTVEYSHQGKACYALEGSTYIAGAAVQWLRDNLHVIKKSSEVESLASEVKNLNEMEHILFMPFFTGIGSPYWEASAKAAIIGLTRDTKNSHIARACLEGISLSINDLIEAIRLDTGLPIKELRVDGGAVENNLLLDIQASVSRLNIIRPKVIETTAYGAGLAAALGAGLIQFQDIKKLWKEDRTFNGVNSWSDYYTQKRQQWSTVIKKLYL